LTRTPSLAAAHAALKQSIPESDTTEKLLTLGVTADFIAGDKQRGINASDIEAWKVVAREARIEIK
jgi:hypothetical protein